MIGLSPWHHTVDEEEASRYLDHSRDAPAKSPFLLSGHSWLVRYRHGIAIDQEAHG